MGTLSGVNDRSEVYKSCHTCCCHAADEGVWPCRRVEENLRLNSIKSERIKRDSEYEILPDAEEIETRQHQHISHHRNSHKRKTDEFGKKTRKIHGGKHRTVKHKHKHRGERLHFGRYTVDAHKVRLRHHSRPYYGRYTQESVDSVLEQPHHSTSIENKHFERWKVKHWATLRSAAGRSPAGTSPIHQLRKWGLRKKHEEKLAAEHWSESNSIGQWSREEEEHRQREARHKAKAEAKATLLANNRWPAEPPGVAAPLPHFAYHRVTSTPSLSRGGRSPTRQSAYVAVSLVPNTTQILHT